MPTQGSCWCLRAAKHRALGELDSLFRLALSLTTCVWKSAEFGGHPPALDTIHLLGKMAPAIDFFFPVCYFLPIYSCYQSDLLQLQAGMLPESLTGLWWSHSKVNPRARVYELQGDLWGFNLEYPGFHTKTCRIWMISLNFHCSSPWLKIHDRPKKISNHPTPGFSGIVYN